MKLNYVATNIANAERECGLKFFTVLSSLGSEDDESKDDKKAVAEEKVDVSKTDTKKVDASKVDFGISELVFLCKAGGASDEEINSTFKTGFENVLIAIMEGLSTAGFFGELEIDTEEIRNAVKKSLPVSRNTGKAAKN